MMAWRHLVRLALNKATLNRVMGEIALQRACVALDGSRSRWRVLVAGGTRAAGSEKVVVERLRGDVVRLVANIDARVQPDVLGDLSDAWPFRDSSFDLVLSTWVLAHLADPVQFFEEAGRVLASGGCLIGAVPFLHRVHGAPGDYWRFTDTALIRMGHMAGFERVMVEPIGGTPFLALVTLAWPFLRIPGSGLLAATLAAAVDGALLALVSLTRKGALLARSYPVGYVWVCGKSG